MHLSAPFIKRPVATSLLSLALLLAGSVAYSLLPVASLPDVDYAGDRRRRGLARRQPGDHGLGRRHARWSASSAASPASTR